MDWVTVHGVQKLMELKDTYEYVPITSVIQAMIQNKVIYQEVKNTYKTQAFMTMYMYL